MKALADDLNTFQRGLSLNEVYVKNETASLSRIEDRDSFKILTWNIERGARPNSIAAYINQVQPDVVCLQEVDWGNERTSNVDVLNHIACSTSMLGLFSVEFFEIETPARPQKLAGGGAQGNAILTRILPTRYFRIELPVTFDWLNAPARKKEIVRREKRIGARFALCLEFEGLTKPLIVCSAHFEDKGGGIEGRFDQFKCLADAIRNTSPEEKMSIIAGDFNSRENWILSVNGEKGRSLGKPWHVSECHWWQKHLLPEIGYIDPFTCEDWTYKSWMLYKEKLDWIAVKNCQIVEQGIGGFNTSDHRPLWLRIRL